MSFAEELAELTEQIRYLSSLDVLTLDFQGFQRDMYIVSNVDQSSRGLNGITHIDSDGMLIYKGEATYAPIRVGGFSCDMDIAWYSADKSPLGHTVARDTATIFVAEPYSYYTISPVGTLPFSEWSISG